MSEDTAMAEDLSEDTIVLRRPRLAKRRNTKYYLVDYKLNMYDPGDDYVKNRKPYQTILVEHFTKKKVDLGDAVVTAIEEGNLPTILPHEQEKCPPSNTDKNSGVIVGIVLPPDSDRIMITAARGSEHDTPDHNVIPPHINALRVVARRFGTNTTYYALTSQDPQTKLCKAHQVDRRNVFFAIEFRTQVEAQQHLRSMFTSDAVKKTWQDDNMALQVKRRRQPSAAKEKNKMIQVETLDRVTTEVLSSCVTFDESGDRAYLTQALEQLERINPSPPSSNNRNLMDLLSGTIKLKKKQFDIILIELEDLWPPIAKLCKDAGGTAILARICHGLREPSGMVVKFRFARVFLAALLNGMLSMDPPGEGFQDAQIRSQIETALKVAEDCVGSGEPPKQTSSNSRSASVRHTADALKQIRIKREQEYGRLCMETSDGTVIPETFPMMYNTYVRSLSAEQSQVATTDMFPLMYSVCSQVFGSGLAELRKLERDTYRFAQCLDDEEEDDDELDDRRSTRRGRQR